MKPSAPARKSVFFLVGFDQSRLVTNITLLKAEEVDEILAGHDNRFKAVTATVEPSAK